MGLPKKDDYELKSGGTNDSHDNDNASSSSMSTSAANSVTNIDILVEYGESNSTAGERSLTDCRGSVAVVSTCSAPATSHPQGKTTTRGDGGGAVASISSQTKLILALTDGEYESAELHTDDPSEQDSASISATITSLPPEDSASSTSTRVSRQRQSIYNEPCSDLLQKRNMLRQHHKTGHPHLDASIDNDAKATPILEPGRRLQSAPGAFRGSSSLSNAQIAYHANEEDTFYDGNTISGVETGGEHGNNAIANASCRRIAVPPAAEIDASPVEEDDQRIRDQIRKEIIRETIEANVVTENRKTLLIWLIVVLLVAAVATGICLRVIPKKNLTHDSESQETATSQNQTGDIKSPSPSPTISSSPTDAPSDFPTPITCPCFSKEEILDLQSALPDWVQLDCGSFGSSDVGFNCRDNPAACGFDAKVFCAGDCATFTHGVRGCTTVEESTRERVVTIKVSEAEDLACRQNVHALCPSLQP